MNGKTNIICRFCLNLKDMEDLVILENIQNMVQTCLPEMNSHFVEGGSICQPCLEHLEEYFKFVMRCLEVERKTSESLKNAVTSEASSFDVTPRRIKEEHDISIKEEVLTDNTEAFSANKKGRNLETWQCRICNYKTMWKGSLKRHLHVHKSSDETTTFKCRLCEYEGNLEECFREHVKFHEKNKTDVFKCHTCNYKSKCKRKVHMHVQIHKSKTLYICQICSRIMTNKANFNKHMLIHKDFIKFTCEICGRELKHKTSLERHLLIHQRPGKWKCAMCRFETKFTYQLERHMEFHKNVEEILKYRVGVEAHSKSV